MASIGRTYLGGRKAQGPGTSEFVNGAVAFQLDRPASEDWMYQSQDALSGVIVSSRQPPLQVFSYTAGIHILVLI
jgi:hypothetical protein